MKKIAILGSTGSIGTQTLSVIEEHADDFEVTALACGNNIRLLEEQMRKFRPKLVAVWSKEAAASLRVRTADLGIPVETGMDGLLAVATYEESEILVTAIVGMLGIRPTIAAIKAKKTIALANKETLVTAGHLIIPLAAEYGVSILPVDSEHSAIFQSLQGNEENPISKILLTASGGPFRGRKKQDLLHNVVFTFHIDVGCRLIEDIYRTVMQKCSCKGESLTLTAGKIGCFFRKFCIQSFFVS